ncbi:hypothetical protein RJ55_07564 [Drechmeria coniospora]|nr:hypothetical protein RJ55_07564 [Drechmeria coniospora]
MLKFSSRSSLWALPQSPVEERLEKQSNVTPALLKRQATCAGTWGLSQSSHHGVVASPTSSRCPSGFGCCQIVYAFCHDFWSTSKVCIWRQ